VYSEMGFPIGDNRKFRLRPIFNLYEYTVGRYDKPLVRFDKNVHGFKCAIEHIIRNA